MVASRRAAGLLVLLASCASGGAERAAEPPPSPPPPLSGTPGGVRVDASLDPDPTADPTAAGLQEPAEGASRPVGWVAGAPITAEDLLVSWNQDASREVFLVVEKVVSVRLALAEAQRLGMRLDPEAVELEVARARQSLTEHLGESGLDLSLDEFVESRLGLRPQVYFERLRVATIRRMLTERAVRSFTLSNDWARVRMLVVATREEADAMRARIEEGEDIADLAREASLDASAEDGGLVPFLLRSEGTALAVSVFAATPGELVGPFTMSGHQVLVSVEELHGPLTGDWDTVGAQVEDSLAHQGVTDAEFVHWKLEMERRYPIDLGPLEELLGAAR